MRVASLLAATIFWPGGYLIGSAAASSIPLLDLTAMRWVITLVPLLLVAWVVERPDWRRVALARGLG